MIRIFQYTQEFHDIWDDFIDRSKSPMFMFHRNFMEYHADRFTDFSLLFYDDDKLVALLPASVQDGVLCSHGGLTYGGFFTAPETKQHHINDCVDALITYLHDRKIHEFIYKSVPYIYHLIPAEEYLWPLLQHGANLWRSDVASVIDLENPQKMSKGRKAQIARARRENVSVAESEDFENFIRLENQVLWQHHQTKAVHTAAELVLLKSRFPENIRLWTAMHGGQMIAGALVFIYSNCVHTQYLAANETARQIGGLDLLIKHLIDYFQGKKKWFDFGISTEQNGTVFNTGLCAQKESFGARSVAYNFYRLEL